MKQPQVAERELGPAIMVFDIDSTELIYLAVGPGAILVGAFLLRLDLRLRSRFDELAARLGIAEERIEKLMSAKRETAPDPELEQRLAMLTRQQEQLMMRDTEAAPYFQAIKQAESGASVEALMQHTGVSRAEAELIVRLHGGSDGASAPG